MCTSSDERVLNFVNCTGIDEYSIPQVSVYPNPSNGQFFVTITGNQPKKFNISIYDLQGQVVYDGWYQDNGSTGTREILVNLENVKPGSYVLLLSNEELKVTEQVFIK